MELLRFSAQKIKAPLPVFDAALHPLWRCRRLDESEQWHFYAHFAPTSPLPAFANDVKEAITMNLNNSISMQTHPDYRSEIAALLRSNLTPLPLKERIQSYHERDIAAALQLFSAEERSRFYNVLDAQILASALEYCEDANLYLSELSMRRRVEIIARMEPARAAEALEQMSKADRDAIMDLLAADVRHEISLINSFDEDAIGSRMTTNYICIDQNCDVRAAMRELVRQAAECDNISTLYVVNEESKLLGAIDLKDLILARQDTPLSSILTRSYPYVYTNEPINACIDRIRNYSEDSIPVLDAGNRLCGVLTSQAIAQLTSDELGEDYAMLAGLSAEEDLQEPIRKSIGKRLPWLIVLLGLGLVVSGVVGLFEGVMAHLTIIVSFQSLILDMAGNVGTQSLAVTIRVLMDESVDRRSKLRLIGKEARIGLLNGVILGAASFACIGLYLVALKGQSLQMALGVSVCIGAALIVSILLSSICGTVIPMLFKKIHIDPAVASGPLITTVNDLVAVVAYYGLAWLLLIQMLQL